MMMIYRYVISINILCTIYMFLRVAKDPGINARSIHSTQHTTTFYCDKLPTKVHMWASAGV